MIITKNDKKLEKILKRGEILEGKYLDTVLSIMEVLHAGYGDSKYRPCPLLRQYVNAGWLGKKSGRGFYAYE